jgi:hypothetical protein
MLPSPLPSAKRSVNKKLVGSQFYVSFNNMDIFLMIFDCVMQSILSPMVKFRLTC